MPTRAIPKTHQELIELATLAAGAADALGDPIGLLQNTALRIRADLRAVNGNSTAAPDAGSEHVLNAARATLSSTRATRRQALADGRSFCAASVDLLKIHLGRRWNPKWFAAGFIKHSLAIPYDPLSMLTGLRDYFRDHAEHENAALTITAARADELATALIQTTSDVLEKQATRQYARRGRDAAVQKLAARMRGLRAELEQLLPRDDARWHRFGFSRPIDRRQPQPVDSVTLEPQLPGVVQATWPATARAENYRVTWTVEGASEPPQEVELVAETTVRLDALPTGVPVIIAVSARNRAGESLPTTARIVVP